MLHLFTANIPSSFPPYGVFRPFLLHGLVFGKAQSDSLGHFDVAFRALLHATDFSLGQRLAAKARHARVKTPAHHIVVHAGRQSVVCVDDGSANIKCMIEDERTKHAA